MKFLFLLLFLSLPAQALEVNDPACQALERHKTINDATYRAGVDVKGNAVVPADLGVSAPAIIKNVTRIPLTVDLAERLQGLGAPVQGGLELDANFGILEIHQDGRVMLEGQDLTNNVQTLCGKSHKVMSEEKIIHQEKQLPFEGIQKPVIKTGKISVQEVEILDFPAPEPKVLMEDKPVSVKPDKTKIVTDKPDLIPDEILSGEFYRE